MRTVPFKVRAGRGTALVAGLPRHHRPLYRNHSYISRCLGNLIGLGRLQAFVAAQAGLKAGPLTCISTHAEIHKGDDKDRTKNRGGYHARRRERDRHCRGAALVAGYAARGRCLTGSATGDSRAMRAPDWRPGRRATRSAAPGSRAGMRGESRIVRLASSGKGLLKGATGGLAFANGAVRACEVRADATVTLTSPKRGDARGAARPVTPWRSETHEPCPRCRRDHVVPRSARASP